jgi:hypothetical protein
VKNQLRDLFISLNSHLLNSLVVNRAIYNHPTAKGDSTENDWENMLSQHLPHRYQVVKKTFIIDSESQQSEQIDLVIMDRQYSPILFNKDGGQWIPIESVYAIFEVKQTLNKVNFEYANGKTKSVRGLKRCCAPITAITGIHEAKEPFEILSGLLTTECDWRTGFGSSFQKVIKGCTHEERLNIGCDLSIGAYLLDYDSDENVIVQTSGKDISLAFFLFNFLSKLQLLGTAPAIDYKKYLRKISDS